MISAIGKELRMRNSFLNNEPIQTVYFGGGTPSLLEPPEISDLMDVIRQEFDLMPQAEITLEANPDDLTEEKLRALFVTGINRLSIGIQSFDDTSLKFMNRIHNGMVAEQAFHDARTAGFANISVDLIFAVPGMTASLWEDTIRKTLLLQPEHISCYSLTIEDKTVFGKWTAAGKLKPAGEETEAEQMQILTEALSEAGYDRYEISNFARPGFESQHNSSYWKRVPYLGVGPGAHSFNGTIRQHNVPNNALYIKSIHAGSVPQETEQLSRETMINETIMVSLRTKHGCDLDQLKRDYGYDLLNASRRYITDLVNRDFAMLKSNYFILSEKGKFVADKIASDLFVIP